MNTRIVCTGTLLLCLVSIVPPARAAELIAAANAMISTREPTNNTGAMSSFCNLPKPAGADIGGMMLFRFDLPPLSGRPVIGDGTFFLHCYWHQSGFHFPYEIRTIPSNDWAEDTVTWANLVGSISNDVWRAIVGNRMAILTVDTSGVTYEWTVSNEVLQSWINNPAVFNHGLAIIPVPDANACWYARQRASFDPERAPRLTFTVQNDPPLTPTNLTPVNGSVDVLRSATLTASAYHDPDGDSHASSRWQVATNSFPIFGNALIVWDSGYVSTSLTSVTTPRLAANTRYWWRVRYCDALGTDDGCSSWSAPTHFDTGCDILPPEDRPAVAMAQICPVYAASNINAQTSSTMKLPDSQTNVAPAGFIMIRFDLGDLSMCADIAAFGGACLDVFTIWTPMYDPPVFNLHALKQPWDETTVTWNNYVGSNWSAWASLLGPKLDDLIIDMNGQTARFFLSQALIQSWLNQPGHNYGIALVPGSTGDTIWRADPRPRLIFDLINTNAPAPDQPVNVAPPDRTRIVTVTPVLQCSSYAGGGTHAASRWRIARDPVMADLVWDSGARADALTSVEVPAGVLHTATRYSWDVRHINAQGGKSVVSVPTSFSTPVFPGFFTRFVKHNSMIDFSDQSGNENGEENNYFTIAGSSNGVYGGMIFMWADMDAFEDMEADGDGEFMVHFDTTGETTTVALDPGGSRIDNYFSCYRLRKPWSESSVTWENYVGPGQTNFWPVLGEYFGSQNAFAGQSCIWTISQATLQDWLDNPETNFGLALYPDQDTTMVMVCSRRALPRAPELLFGVVPEPAAAMVMVMLAVLARRRTCQ